MKNQTALIEAIAKGYACRYTGISMNYINKALRGEREGPLAQTAIQIYREKRQELIEATTIPHTVKA